MEKSYPPSVDAVVRAIGDDDLPRQLVIEVVRAVIDDSRSEPDMDVTAESRRRLDQFRNNRPRRVINATGVLLHTNLGRAPWAEPAITAAEGVSAGYGNVELDVTTGERGHRNAATEEYLKLLTGAEAALVVNNNAAALFLVLLALGSGRAVPVSRGELIEIGGSYRLPDLMAATGARLVEVGTTNRTRVDDYAAVADPALILKVHPSNYRIVGFNEDASVRSLADLAAERGVPLVFDVGSGLIDERVPWTPGPPPAWLNDEPGVRQSLESGADLVLFSGDKLLGGPQAGVIVGRADLVASLRRHPATRALRIDGATDAALAATLECYLTGRALDIPLWRMASLNADEVGERARSAASQIEGATTVDGSSTMGAGAAPGAELPTVLIRVPDGDSAFTRLLAADPPVLGRRSEGSLLLDLRTVDASDDSAIVAAFENR